MEVLEFTTVLKEQPVTIDGKPYKLKELTGPQRDSFLDNIGERAVYNNGQMTGLKKYKGLQSALLQLCFYNENDQLVSREEIDGYPASVQTELFKAAQVLSGLEDKAREVAKNG